MSTQSDTLTRPAVSSEAIRSEGFFSDDLRASDHRLQCLVAELAHPS